MKYCLFLAMLFLSTQLFAMPSALACSQFRVKTGCGLRWYGKDGKPPRVEMQVDNGGTEKVSAIGLQQAADAAMKTWQSVDCHHCESPDGAGCAPVECSTHSLGVELVDLGLGFPTPAGPGCSNHDGGPCQVVPNGNFVHVVKDNWEYGQFQLALTVVTNNLATGEIVDADVMLNQVQHSFCLTNCSPQSDSLQNTLTHEFGHVLGLDHSADLDATMYVSAPTAEVKKISLEDDDRLCICQAYRQQCLTCEPPVTAPPKPCCAARPSARTGALLPIFLMAAALLRRRWC